jgi:hypothetical protein
VQGAKMVLFADDTILLIIGTDESDLQHKIINVMIELEVWFQRNNPIINTEKTIAMLFYSKHMRFSPRLQITFENIKIPIS